MGVILLVAISSMMSHSYKVPFKDKKKFYNHEHEQLHSFFWHSCLLFFRSRYRLLTRKKVAIHKWIEPSKQVSSCSLTWIGHSTFLIHYKGITILTDPIFGNASFLFKRIAPPGIALKQLPPIDMILLSHNHRDHMDAKSLLQLRSHQPHILIPEGVKGWFNRHRFDGVEELIWWEQKSYIINNEQVTITFLPAHHWSQRSLFDRNKSLWGSWMIQFEDYTIYFAGDTAYSSHFTAIKERFATIDVALLPIGPCEPHHTMKHSHINAAQACQAFIDLGARTFIPMHWGTFYFGLDSFEQPIEQLLHCWQQLALPPEQLHVLKFGQQWDFVNRVPLRQGRHDVEVVFHKTSKYFDKCFF